MLIIENVSEQIGDAQSAPMNDYRTKYSEECVKAVREASKHPLTFEEAKRQVERKRRMSELGDGGGAGSETTPTDSKSK